MKGREPDGGAGQRETGVAGEPGTGPGGDAGGRAAGDAGKGAGTASALSLAPGAETARIGAFLEACGRAAGSPADGRAAIGGGAVLLGPGDDAAAIGLEAGHRLVLSTDASVEGVHFRRAWMTWEVIGYRAAASGLSDLAAMAAEPVGLLVSAALPPELDAGTAAALGRGVGEALAWSGGVVLGGDLVASPGPVFLDVTVVGQVDRPLIRAGAEEGQEVWVTGRLGGAAAAVADLLGGLEPLPSARLAFERPRPRIREAVWLAARVRLGAAIDLSDGLARDARHLAMASDVRLEMEWDRLPIHPAVEPHLESPVAARLVLGGGEDYELLLTAPAGALAGVRAQFEEEFGIPLTRIGRVEPGAGVAVRAADGSELRATAFEHFPGGAS